MRSKISNVRMQKDGVHITGLSEYTSINKLHSWIRLYSVLSGRGATEIWSYDYDYEYEDSENVLLVFLKDVLLKRNPLGGWFAHSLKTPFKTKLAVLYISGTRYWNINIDDYCLRDSIIMSKIISVDINGQCCHKMSLNSGSAECYKSALFTHL